MSCGDVLAPRQTADKELLVPVDDLGAHADQHYCPVDGIVKRIS